MISSKNQQKRLQTAKVILQHDSSFSRQVIWSDETMVKARPDSRQVRYFARDFFANQFPVVNRQVQGGGFSVMLWGCVSYHSMGPLVVVDGSLTAESYIDILKNYLCPELSAAPIKMLFQQDHAPCHSAKQTLKFLDENGILLIPHPPQSPDLKPIEIVWAMLKQKLYSDFPLPDFKQELINKIFTIWNEFPIDTIRKLVNGMHLRYLKVTEAKGLWID